MLEIRRELYSVRDAQNILGVGKTMVYELIKLGGLTKIKIGRRTFVTRSSVESLTRAQ